MKPGIHEVLKNDFSTDFFVRADIFLKCETCCALLRQPDSGKLPARLWRKEIAVACANVPRRRDARSATQHHLPTHELAVVLAQRSVQRLKARIAKVGAARPHPAVAKVLSCFLIFAWR